jgi:hypothetical protein
MTYHYETRWCFENSLAEAERARVVRIRRILGSAIAVWSACDDAQTVTPDRTAALPDAILRGRSRSKGKPERPGAWQRVVASLSFDSRLQLSSAPTRGPARTRQMLFTSEQVEIDLQFKPGREVHDLFGQVLGAGRMDKTIPAFVCLQNTTGQLYRATETDSLGLFAFRQIPPGVYDLVLDLGNQEVAVTGLDLQND